MTSIMEQNENYPKTLQHKLTKFTVDEKLAEAKEKLRHEIKRSISIFRVDTGTCNGCDIEFYASITPLFDVERFGIKMVATPRHADILIMEGPLTRPMRMPAIRAYEAAPDTKLVMAFGACACSGGIYHDFYANWGGIDQQFPVDVYLPGCPPTPEQFIYAFCVLLDKLAQRLHHEDIVEGEGSRVPLLYPGIPYKARIYLQRKARQMVGYVQAVDVQNVLLPALSRAVDEGKDPFEALGHAIGATDDPRLAEVYEAIGQQLRDLSVTQAERNDFMRKTLVEVVRNTQPLDDNQALEILAKAFGIAEA